MTREVEVDQLRDLMHFALPGLRAALMETLICGHAADMIVKHELGTERNPTRSRTADRLSDREMQRPRIILVHGDLRQVSNEQFGAPSIFIKSNLDVLQQGDELRHTPTQFAVVGLYQDELLGIDDHEPPGARRVLRDHRTRNQVAVVCDKKDISCAVQHRT